MKRTNDTPFLLVKTLVLILVIISQVFYVKGMIRHHRVMDYLQKSMDAAHQNNFIESSKWQKKADDLLK